MLMQKIAIRTKAGGAQMFLVVPSGRHPDFVRRDVFTALPDAATVLVECCRPLAEQPEPEVA